MAKEGPASGATPAVTGSTVLKVLEDLLVTLRRSSKDLAFYPSEHPMLKRSLDRALSQLHSAAAIRTPLAVDVGRTGFSFGGQPVGPENAQVVEMAAELFARRIQQISFARDVESQELAAFLRTISSDPKLLLQQGGPAKVLAGTGAHRIQVSEFDFRRLAQAKGSPDRTADAAESPSKAVAGGEPAPPDAAARPLSRSRETEPRQAAAAAAAGQPAVASPAAPSSGTVPGGSASQVEQTVEALVQRLEQEAMSGRPAGYEWAASRVETAAGRAVREHKLADTLAILRVLLRHRQGTDFMPPVRERAARAVETIATGETVPYLVGTLGAAPGTPPEDLSTVLLGLGARVIPPLLDRLSTEGEAGRVDGVRILERLVESAQAEVERGLQGLEEEPARHLASILGQVGDEGCVALLACLVRHRSARVRLESVRGLGRIGGALTHRPLLQAVRDPDPTVLELAVEMVGAVRARLATPTLLRLAGQRVLAGKPFAIRKAAVAALGAMGDSGSISLLTGLLRTRAWFRRKAVEELRLAAALALLRMGRAEAREVVEAGADSGRGDVRRACEAALQRLSQSSPAVVP